MSSPFREDAKLSRRRRKGNDAGGVLRVRRAPGGGNTVSLDGGVVAHNSGLPRTIPQRGRPAYP